MKVTIIDERNGDVVTPQMQAAIAVSRVVLVINSDGHIEVRPGGDDKAKIMTINASFFEAPHRDSVSAAESRAEWDRQQKDKYKDEPGGYSDDAMVKAKRALGHDV